MKLHILRLLLFLLFHSYITLMLTNNVMFGDYDISEITHIYKKPTLAHATPKPSDCHSQMQSMGSGRGHCSDLP